MVELHGALTRHRDDRVVANDGSVRPSLLGVAFIFAILAIIAALMIEPDPVTEALSSRKVDSPL